MAGSPGVISAADLNFNINGEHEEDEEDIEEERLRKEMLNAQLEHAFDDCWNESECEDDSGNSSSSDEDGANNKNSHRSLQGTDMIFHKLSSISERSPDKTNVSENSISHSRFVFSPPGSGKFLETNGGNIRAMDGRGDEIPQFQQLFKKVSTNNTSGQFQPIFSKESHSENCHDSVNEKEEVFTQIVTNGHAEENQPYQLIFKNNAALENGDNFQHTISDKSRSELSNEFIDETAEAYRQAEYNSVEQLRVLYEVRMREIKELQADKLRAANLQQEMLQQMTLMEAEKQRALLSRTEPGF